MSHRNFPNPPDQDAVPVPDHRTAQRRVGDFGEDAAAYYLKRHGFTILGRNIGRKTGELDIVARKGSVLHIVEVKTIACREFPQPAGGAGQEASAKRETYDPAENLHYLKLRKIVRTAEWYVAESGWEGEWQVDAVLVWRRGRDGRCKVRYLPQIL